MKLSTEQSHTLASLLVNFSDESVAGILSQYSPAQRQQIERALETVRLSPGTCAPERHLVEFVQWLAHQSEATSAARMTPTTGRAAAHLQTPLRTATTPRHDACQPHAEPDGESPALALEQLMTLTDAELDRVLEYAPADMTIDMLGCCPEAFRARVLSRLTDDEVDYVSMRIDADQPVTYDDMAARILDYRDCAERLLNKETSDEI